MQAKPKPGGRPFTRETGRDPADDRIDPRAQTVARALLTLMLLGLGLYMIAEFLRALAWAVVLAIALWPLYGRAERWFPPGRHNLLWPSLFTALVALVFLLPFAVLGVEAVREAHDLLDYAKQLEQSGVSVPAFVQHLPYGAQAASDWWNANLAHAGWAQELLHRLDTTSNRELTRNLGANLVHRIVVFVFALVALFFLFRENRVVVAQCNRASRRLFGDHGGRVAAQMAASVHGTVDGLVLVGLGVGLVLGIVYAFSGVPHPVLFGAASAVLAIFPFGGPLAVILATATLLVGGSVTPAIIVAVVGFTTAFVADHFLRPALIGGTTKLPFLWVLFGILGGVESFGLLGLFVGPAVMAALILLWREFTEPRHAPAEKR